MNQISVFDSPTKPAFAGEEAQRLLARGDGVGGRRKDLASERDQDFRVEPPSGKFVPKIANAVGDEALPALQNAAMKHVAQADPTPRPRRGKPDDVEIAALADPYRGRFKGAGENGGIAHAASVAERAGLIRARTGQGPAANPAQQGTRPS